MELVEPDDDTQEHTGAVWDSRAEWGESSLQELETWADASRISPTS